MGYILSKVAGASDHLAKIAAKEMAITEMISRNPTVFFIFPHLGSIHILIRLRYCRKPLNT